jgi:hypothetical protein
MLLVLHLSISEYVPEIWYFQFRAVFGSSLICVEAPRCAGALGYGVKKKLRA